MKSRQKQVNYHASSAAQPEQEKRNNSKPEYQKEERDRMNAERESRRRVSAARSSCAAGARPFPARPDGGLLPAGLTVLSDCDPEQNSRNVGIRECASRQWLPDIRKRLQYGLLPRPVQTDCSYNAAGRQQRHCSLYMPDILCMMKRRIHDNFAVVVIRPVRQKITLLDADAREIFPKMAD